jgi:PPE-repeat protein
MDSIALPPEITSALIHSGPGAESMIEASGAWQRLGSELESSAGTYTAVVSSLVESWSGPSPETMVEALAPYLVWLRTTAQQCQQLGYSAQAAAVAFTSVRSAVVPPAQVTANRARLAQLLATNGFGRNLPAIAEVEDQYQSMWATNSAAMIRYQAASAQATELPQFTSPPAIANPAAAATQASATAAANASAAASSPAASILSTLTGFDPNAGWFGLANTYANQFISSGFPVNMLSYLAQTTAAEALQGVSTDVGQGLSEGEAALGSGLSASTASLSNAIKALGSAPTAAMGVAVPMGKLSAPPAVVGLLPAAQAHVELTSAVSPLSPGDAGFAMLPPLMAPPISAGSGWRKRKQLNYEDLNHGAEVKGTFMPRPPSAG